MIVAVDFGIIYHTLRVQLLLVVAIVVIVIVVIVYFVVANPCRVYSRCKAISDTQTARQEATRTRMAMTNAHNNTVKSLNDQVLLWMDNNVQTDMVIQIDSLLFNQLLENFIRYELIRNTFFNAVPH